MKFSDFDFFLREAWNGFLRSGVMSVVSIVTITISLTVFGMFLLLLFNINSLMDGLSNKMEIVCYIKDMDSREHIQNLQARIEGVQGVKEVSFTSRQTAWNRFQDNFQGKVSLEGLLNKNPLPDSFVVRVANINLIPGIAQQLATFSEIEDIRYGGTLAERVSRFYRVVKIGGWGTIFLLGLATLLIVVNTIRLTVLARQNEIAIMKLVGATDQFVRWPFIIEGIFIGIGGAISATLILKVSYNLLIPRLQESLPFLPFVFAQGKLNWIYFNVAVVGTLLGLFGASMSVNKLLRDEN